MAKANAKKVIHSQKGVNEGYAKGISDYSGL